MIAISYILIVFRAKSSLTPLSQFVLQCRSMTPYWPKPYIQSSMTFCAQSACLSESHMFFVLFFCKLASSSTLSLTLNASVLFSRIIPSGIHSLLPVISYPVSYSSLISSLYVQPSHGNMNSDAILVTRASRFLVRLTQQRLYMIRQAAYRPDLPYYSIAL